MQSEKFVKSFSRLKTFGKRLLPGIFSRDPQIAYRKPRTLPLALLGIALLTILVVGITAVREKRPYDIKTKKNAQPPTDATFEIKNVFYNYTNKNNQKEWELRADNARYYKDEKLAFLENIEVIFFRSDGAEYRLTGKRGQINIETQNIEVAGDVRGTLPENTKVATESFFYDHNKRMVTTNDKVLITRDTFSMEGVGMVIDVKEEKLTLLNKVKAMENK